MIFSRVQGVAPVHTSCSRHQLGQLAPSAQHRCECRSSAVTLPALHRRNDCLYRQEDGDARLILVDRCVDGLLRTPVQCLNRCTLR